MRVQRQSRARYSSDQRPKEAAKPAPKTSPAKQARQTSPANPRTTARPRHHRHPHPRHMPTAARQRPTQRPAVQPKDRIRAFSALARDIYAGVPPVRRLMMTYRPLICPFHEVFDAVPPGATVLDLGCGAGLLLNLLASERTIRAGVGIDLSAGAIAAATAANQRLNTSAQPADPLPHITFTAQPADAAWPGEPFTTVTAVDLLHHLPRDQHAPLIRRAARAVPAAGRLIIKDMRGAGVIRPLANRCHDLLIAGDWIHFPEPDTIIAAAASEGLELHQRRTIDTLWYGHELYIFERPAP